MKIKISALSLICFLIACRAPIVQETNYYQQNSKFLFEQMLSTLKEFGWHIKWSGKNSSFQNNESWYEITADSINKARGDEGVCFSMIIKIIEEEGRSSMFFKIYSHERREYTGTMERINIISPNHVGSVIVSIPGDVKGPTKRDIKRWTKKIMGKFHEKIK